MTTDGLSIYAIQRVVGGSPVTEFDDVIDAKHLLTVDETHDFQSPAGTTPAFSAKLFVWRGEPQPPAWVSFLEEGFGAGSITVPDSSQSRAVLLVKIKHRFDRIYAIPFGSGRFQIRKDVIDRRYGLRVALNSLYQDDDLSAAPRIRQVESKTVAVNTMRTMRQANRDTEFSEFALDPDSDELAGVTGQPADQTWARRVRGTDSLRLARRTSFAELGELCRNVARFHERKDYKKRFDFVDRFEGISDPARIVVLIDLLRNSLSNDQDAWALAMPGVQDFDSITSYRVTGPSGDTEEFVDPTIGEIADLVGDDLVDRIGEIRIESLDGEGHRLDQWSLLECLDGQLLDDGKTFLLESGAFYSIEPNYLNQLNNDIDAIPFSSVVLPDSVRVLVNGQLKEIEEGDYNNIAAASDARFLLLDKKTVIVPGRTSPIEVCDVLTLDRQLIHVKRKFSSSSLSHLFGQGYVSSELLIDSVPYREAIRNTIGDTDTVFRDLFSPQGALAAEWEVVYGIVGPWGAHTAAEKLPFFSKVNLRTHARQLRRMGFKVTLARIPVVDP